MSSRRVSAVLVVAWVLSCAGLVRLGVWQLDRAAEKHARHAVFTARREQPPLDPDTFARDPDPASLHWRRAAVRGHYADQHLLLDNRVREGRAGYELLTVLETEGGLALLVNRGWLPVGEDRARAPEVTTPGVPVRLDGYLGPPPVTGISLSGAATVERMTPNLARVQTVTVNAAGGIVGAALQRELWPLMIYLDPGASGAYDVHWRIPGSGAERHRAYAVQWFSMAVILAAIGLWQWRRSMRR